MEWDALCSPRFDLTTPTDPSFFYVVETNIKTYTHNVRFALVVY